MRIKYNRTSTISQQGQRFEIDTDIYDLVLFDQLSGTVPFNERPESKKLIDLVEDGKVNVVVFEEISRIGRNTVDTLRVLEFLEMKGVNVVIRNMGIQSRPIEGEKNPIWGILTSILSSTAQLEADLIRTRTMQGREVSRLKGNVRFGRPPFSNENEKTFLSKDKSKRIIKYLEKGLSIREVSKILGVSTKTVVKVKKIIEKNKNKTLVGSKDND